MSPSQLNRRTVLQTAGSGIGIILAGCTSRGSSGNEEPTPTPQPSPSTTPSETPSTTPGTEASKLGEVVLSNQDSVTHTLTVTIKRYGEVIESKDYSVSPDARTAIPLREPGAYSITVELDGESVNRRDSLTGTTKCRWWRYDFRVTSAGELEKQNIVCLE